MNAQQQGSHPQPLLSQAENNTTLWIGHLHNDATDHFGGQTFTSPEAGPLNNIQLYAASVQHPGEMQMSFHEFDDAKKSWGPSLAECAVHVTGDDQHNWVRFDLPGVFLQQDTTYGFRVHTSNAMIGLGESVCDSQHPFRFGQEWSADSNDQQGQYYSYFSLAFKVEMA